MKVVKISEVAKEPAVSALFTGGPVSRQVPFQPDESRTFNLGVVSFSAGSRAPASSPPITRNEP
jgi:hypothetical protein